MAKALSTEEKQELVDTFNNPEQMENWMLAYLKSSGKIPDVKSEESNGSDEDLGSPTSPPKRKSHVTQIPKISTFSGDSGNKHEASYELWRYEVDCMIKDQIYTSEIIKQALRRSLKGSAAKVAMRLGADASIEDILDKFEGIYGMLEGGESILAQFYNARQGEKENVNDFGCRLEELLDQAHKSGEFTPTRDMKNKKLCHFFWKGLHQYLKDANGHKYDTIHDFDELRKEIRKSEIDHRDRELEQLGNLKSRKAHVHLANITEQKDQNFSELQSMFKNLDKKFETLSCQVQQIRKSSEKSSVKEAKDNNTNHMATNITTPQPNAFQPSSAAMPSHSNQFYQQKASYWNQYRPTNNSHECFPNYLNMNSARPPFVPQPRQETRSCWKCGQVGHLQYNCLVRTDHLNQGNERRPMYRGNTWAKY